MPFLTFTDVVQVWQIVLLAACMGAVNAFDGPARQAFAVEMVGREDLPNAIALNSMTFNSARIIGPAIGGLLLATVGAAWCFTLNGRELPGCDRLSAGHDDCAKENDRLCHNRLGRS